MTFTPNFISALYVFMLGLILLLCAVLLAATVRQRRQTGSGWFGMMLGSIILLIPTYLLIALNVLPALHYALLLLRLPVLALISTSGLLFVVTYSGWLRLSRVITWALFTLIGVITLAVLTNGSAVYTDWQLVPYGQIMAEQTTWGPLYGRVVGYIMFALLGAFLLPIVQAVREHGARRRQALWLMFAALIGALPALVTLPIREEIPLSPTPLGMLFTVLIYGFLFFRYRLLEIVPFAFDGLFKSMSDGVIYVNLTERIVQINPAAVTLLGQPSADRLYGRPLREVLPELRGEAVELRLPGLEATAAGTTPAPRWVDVRVNPAVNNRGRTIGRVVVLRDITERRRLQQALIEQERLTVSLQKEQELNQLKTQMMIRIAHEFRTPLATLHLFAELLERYFDRMTPQQRTERLHTMRTQITTIADMLDDIAAVLRGEFNLLAPARSTFDLIALCRDRVAQLSSQFPLRPITHLCTELTQQPISADREMVDLILRNLLANAAKFSAMDTPITLEVISDGVDVLISVRDAGIGIPAAEVEKVLTPFYRASNIGEIGGLGLGLSLVRDAVTAHRGTLTLSSIPGLGTTVTVRLPKG